MTTVPRSPLPRSDGDGHVLLVASTGGHLAQLSILANQLAPQGNRVWVTFDSAQSRSLLQGQDCVFVPYIKPRDLVGVARAAKTLWQLLRTRRFERVVSTGAAIAVAAFVVAALRGVPRTYIESVSRVEGPSLTGRIVHSLRLATTYTQHPEWASPRWLYGGSVLSLFSRHAKPSGDSHGPLKLFVTLGTIRPYRFDRMIDAVLESTAGVDCLFTWQIGCTSRDGLPGAVHSEMSADDFALACREADIVVSHAGVGSLLGFLEMGIYPVLVPRARAHGEHVDDHQFQIAKLAGSLGIAVVSPPSELGLDALRSAKGWFIAPQPNGAS